MCVYGISMCVYGPNMCVYGTSMCVYGTRGVSMAPVGVSMAPDMCFLLLVNEYNGLSLVDDRNIDQDEVDNGWINELPGPGPQSGFGPQLLHNIKAAIGARLCIDLHAGIDRQ